MTCRSTPAGTKNVETSQRGVSTITWELQIPFSRLANCKFARTSLFYIYCQTHIKACITACSIRIINEEICRINDYVICCV